MKKSLIILLITILFEILFIAYTTKRTMNQLPAHTGAVTYNQTTGTTDVDQ